MRDRFAGSMISVSIAAAAAGAVVPLSNTQTSARLQRPLLLRRHQPKR